MNGKLPSMDHYMDYTVEVNGRGHSERYLTKAADATEALTAALTLFQEAHGKQSAEEYKLYDDSGELIAQGKVT